MKGKAKKLFEEWLDSDYFITVGILEIKVYHKDVFSILPPSMQWGVYVDFFESQGIYISVGHSNDLENTVMQITWRDESVKSGVNCELDFTIPKTDDVRKKAVTKANEILNERL